MATALLIDPTGSYTRPVIHRPDCPPATRGTGALPWRAVDGWPLDKVRAHAERYRYQSCTACTPLAGA